MKFSGANWCRIQQALANLKCPDCFSVKVKLDDKAKQDKNAKCEKCGCTFEFNPDVPVHGE